MTVAQLIKTLESLPPDLELVRYVGHRTYDYVTEVKVFQGNTATTVQGDLVFIQSKNTPRAVEIRLK